MFLEQSTDKNNCSIEKGRNAHNKQTKQVVYWSEGIRTVRNTKVFVSKQVQVKQEDIPSTTAENEKTNPMEETRGKGKFKVCDGTK